MANMHLLLNKLIAVKMFINEHVWLCVNDVCILTHWGQGQKNRFWEDICKGISLTENYEIFIRVPLT